MDLIETRDDLCTRCYACVRACPVEAMHAAEGAVRADGETCIGCGICLEECSHGAIALADHTQLALDLLAQGDTAAVISPGFPGAFPDDDPLRVIGALRALGFAEVWEAAAGAEMLASTYRVALESALGRTVIASTCPAAVRLIEAHRPDLVQNLAPAVSPEIAASRAARASGRPRVVCITPCAAFRLECGDAGRGRVSPAARRIEGGADVVLTFSELSELFDKSGLRVDQCPPSAPDVAAEGPGRVLPLPAGLLHSVEASDGAFRRGAVNAAGFRECMEVLDAMSSGGITAPVVELSICRGCVDGPGYPENLGAWRRRQAVLAYSAAMESAGGTSVLERLACSGAGRIDLSRTFFSSLSSEAAPAHCRERAALGTRSGDPDASQTGKMERGRYARSASHSFAADSEPVDMVAYSPAMESVIALMQKVSSVSSTVLITGASGVGKEVVARYIHRTGNRSAEPFVKINCAAIPETLLESELFGYEEGAFTGARRSGKPGLIELASGGTLFLDEITEMPMALQAKLLQVLQEKCLVRVGGTKQIRVDARVIAATNRDIERAVKEGRFRNDLYYRLNVIPIRVPSLVERAGDIAPLTYHFLEKWGARYGRPRRISREAREALERYGWPGNVRELENVLEFLVVTVDAPVIGIEHIPTHIKSAGAKNTAEVCVSGIMPLRKAVEEVERQLIERASATCPSTYAIARALGVNQSTIVRKIQRFANGRSG
ncbi:MAG TPA: sigma 54-interacting transcriptional regulator [Bacillota bacterium]|nr:sigma 54-interacting transcriptional regulator [Bacillota bacterium]